MCLLSVAATILFTLVSAATQTPIEKYNGTTTGRYIVQMKDGADRADLQSLILQAVGGQKITHDWNIINGFAGMLRHDPQHCLLTFLIIPGPFNVAALDIICSSPHVQSVSEDGILTISVVQYVVLDQ